MPCCLTIASNDYRTGDRRCSESSRPNLAPRGLGIDAGRCPTRCASSFGPVNQFYLNFAIFRDQQFCTNAWSLRGCRLPDTPLSSKGGIRLMGSRQDEQLRGLPRAGWRPALQSTSDSTTFVALLCFMFEVLFKPTTKPISNSSPPPRNEDCVRAKFEDLNGSLRGWPWGGWVWICLLS